MIVLGRFSPKPCSIRRRREQDFCLQLGVIEESWASCHPAPPKSEGQRILIEAMKYLAQSDPVGSRNAIELLSEHIRNRFPLPSALIKKE
jgi:hypothetical protein